jgi:mono/diheme cytochrome c family protein
MKSKTVSRLVIAAIALAAVIQFIPVNRTNPPVEQEPYMPDSGKAVLTKACYDCHSNETKWPWYSRIAPVSWLVAWDVKEGRGELNFSAWNRMTAKKRDHMWNEVWEMVEKGEMPPAIYTPAHPEARLSDADKEILRAWTAFPTTGP